MTGPIAYIPGFRRPIVKCPRDGWYVETAFQDILNHFKGEPETSTATCRHCGAQVPWVYEQGDPDAPPEQMTLL